VCDRFARTPLLEAAQNGHDDMLALLRGYKVGAGVHWSAASRWAANGTTGLPEGGRSTPVVSLSQPAYRDHIRPCSSGHKGVLTKVLQAGS
jgi:hypothetical protein